jgi:hypothetical protein
MKRGVLLELFCGTGSASKYAESVGMVCVTIDIDPNCKPAFVKDILTVDEAFLDSLKKTYGKITHLWASPDCRAYSAIRRNWQALNHQPPDLAYADSLVRKTLQIIDYLRPPFFWIENPYTGLLKNRALLDHLPATRACYCQYDEGSGLFLTKKQTMIWGSVIGWRPRMCSRADGYCKFKELHGRHAHAIGNSNAIEVPRHRRGCVPQLLVEHLFKQCKRFKY